LENGSPPFEKVGGFINFTTKDGLANNKVLAIYAAKNGVTWFGTFGGGVAAYDGIAWTSLDTRDGLASDAIQAIHPDADGSLWFATQGGITHYRRSTTPPQAHIVSVTTDHTRTDLDALPAFTVGTRITIEYNSIDFLTVPEKRQYRCRIYESANEQINQSSIRNPQSEIRNPYSPPTKDTTFDWVPEKPGTYIFQVQAIDRDLNYSSPATLILNVQPDPALVSMKTELNYLRGEVGRKYHFDNIIGRSIAIKQVYALMEKAIDSGLTVLISGETGTGKELVAKAIHYQSPRKDRPLQELNCGAIPKDLVASTLFGHRKGAFTGANEDKMGLFEVASGGTVLLDEIGEMPEDAQVHLLRVLQEHKVQRIGETQLRDVDVRVIAITNRDLIAEVEAERFREDLYYRVSVFPIHVPPLRERVDDIPLLAEHFLREACRQQNKKLDGFAPHVMEMLQSYPWPGNVRELEHEIARAVALMEEGPDLRVRSPEGFRDSDSFGDAENRDLRIQTYHFSSRLTGGESLIQEILSARIGLSEAVERLQRRLIENALQECGGNRSQAARMLDIHQPNLVRLMKRLSIE
jgi:transcriptional regulator with PAS, ATPase and Fis domain